ncbi:hypothetical protein AALO_G00142480 [Alosa alosa]|uniref:ERC protein 2-like n=1 Tax=Alosa alosa TaxID=278164 RepID=A0AAV6GN97_9TELE|nr:hypothetical protein AALO_G00142480 [Alosa alosa]
MNWQTKDQTKKGPNIKLGPQGDKKDARKDNPMDNPKMEELMNVLEKTRQELDATKQRLSSSQQSLSERDGHLTNMRQERRKHLEEILEMKQQALLAAISEKDANIALLELSASNKKKTQDEVLSLKREKDKLVHQLKQQTQSRMKLIADNYEDDHYHTHPPHPQQPTPQPGYPAHPQHLQHAPQPPYPHAPHPQHPQPPQQHPHPQGPQPHTPNSTPSTLSPTASSTPVTHHHTTAARHAAPTLDIDPPQTRMMRKAFGHNHFQNQSSYVVLLR